MLSRTFGCVRVVWNRTLAERQRRWRQHGTGTTCAETDTALTAMKRDPELAWLNEVSCVPLQQVCATSTALDPTMVIVSREPDGRWYVTFAVGTATAAPLPETGRAAGIDLGVTSFLATSDGKKIANPRHLERRACNLARYQRRLARCQRGSANRARAKAKVARAHRKVRNARQDFLHRTTTQLVRGYDLIAIEDLAVSNMVRNRRLARAISDCGWGEPG